MYLCIHPHPSSVPSGKVAVMENINDTIHPSQPQAQPFGMVDFGPDAHRQPSQVQYQVGQVPIAQNGHEGHAPWTQGTNPLDYTFWGSCGLPVSTNEAFGYATASFQEAILDSNDYSFPDRYDAVFTSPRPHDIYHDSGASINPQVVSRLHNPANVSHHGLVQPSRQMSFMSEKSSSLPFVDSFEEYAPSSIAGESAYSPGCSPGDESVATYNSSPSESPQPRTPSPLLPSPVSPVSLPTDARGIFDYGAMPDADSIDHYFGAGSDTSETSSTRGKRKRGTRDIGKTAEEIDVEDDELPYAQLIYKALMSVPSRKMVLSEIYEYFRMNIPRFAKPRQKGWQNSIRHNLSMNGAFLKEERPRLPGDQTKPRGFIWVLSPEAEKEGVKSTTRFRKANNQRKKNAQCASTPKHASQKKRNRRNTKKDVSTSEETVHSPPQGQISTSSETPIQLKPEKGLEQIILTGEDTTNEDMHPQSDSMANLDSQLSLQEIKFFSEIENVYQMSGFEDCYSNIGDDMPDTYDERPAVDLLLGEGISAFNEQFSLVVDRYAQH